MTSVVNFFTLFVLQDSQPSSDGDLVFCSHSCLILYSSSQSKGSSDTKVCSIPVFQDD